MFPGFNFNSFRLLAYILNLNNSHNKQNLNRMAVATVNLEIEITKQDILSGTKNYVCSSKYIERIVKVSILNVMFHRLPIPDNIFTTKEFDSVSYRAIHPESYGSGIAQLFRKWMKGFLDSFRKKYLKELILYFSDETQDVKEMYRFKFSYEDSIAKQKACTDLTEPTVSLLKNLISLGDFPKLPKNIAMHVELFYKEGTPTGYQPPLFDSNDIENTLKSKMGEEKHHFESDQLGRINTGFHYINVSFKRKTNESQFLQDSERQFKRKRTLSPTMVDSEILDPSFDRKVGKKKKSKWNTFESDGMQSLTSIDLLNNSRHGVSFDVDYQEILDDEDIEAIAKGVNPEP